MFHPGLQFDSCTADSSQKRRGLGRCLVLNGYRNISLHPRTLGRRGKSCLLHTRCLAQQVPSARLGWGHPGLLHLDPRCPRLGTQHSQPRQAELSPKKGVHGTTLSDAVGFLLQEVVGARIHDGTRRWGRILEEGHTEAY